ncbi:aspartate--ammonia ligase [Leptotrichia sp. oral taxon 218]|jgi:aspartate--ammonia ligase|uniref:aspartate--ammonia ligase n=1 Tax=Leptotrichia sp. oral taxon 218 TaxID=712361 RepID=UPI001B8B1B44|nr:aspartate--ammonia ligase [Leptotrichia sp. oral taxon 218]QUB95682.1 aspartate--ammonia ligase [Leptotrichia sp. oral taxon 218]
MSSIFIPEGYDPKYGIMETEIAIKFVKDFFEKELSSALNLTRISAPLFVKKASGLNDNLNGVERPVAFETKEVPGETLEIVHSLAKWKRMALKRYKVPVGQGIYTDMNAIRRDENMDNTHSIYVDQWDWEKVITKEDRNFDFLKETVRKIYKVFLNTERELSARFEKVKINLPNEVTFITSQELENLYPNLTPEERENEFAKSRGAIFVMQIGKVLASGQRHDGRAPDYDDWELNGDLILWDPALNHSLELSSMGIRVDKDALERQLKELNLEERKELDFHKQLLNGELPLTIGGGIGQSRICMFFLQKAHIGEVQASFWTEDIKKVCRENGINLL